MIDCSKDCPVHPGKGHNWDACYQNPKGKNNKGNSRGGSGRGAPNAKGGNAARNSGGGGSNKPVKTENYYHEPVVSSDKPDQHKTNDTHHMDLIGQCFLQDDESSPQARLQWS